MDKSLFEVRAWAIVGVFAFVIATALAAHRACNPGEPSLGEEWGDSLMFTR